MAVEPDWVGKARTGFRPTTSEPRTFTTISRGDSPVSVLHDYVLPSTPNPDILLVGVGLKSREILCPTVPYRLAGFLESQNARFRMKLVDIDANALSDVGRRTTIFLGGKSYDEDERARKSWNAYLLTTGGVDRVIKEPHPQLSFDFGEDAEFAQSGLSLEEYTERYLNRGVRSAPVTNRFRTMLATGDISLNQGDIARMDLEPGSADYADCMFVLYQLTTEGQQLAISNMARALRPGGILHLNDVSGFNQFKYPPMLKELGGWLGAKQWRELGLDPVKIYVDPRKRPSYRLKLVPAQARVIARKI